MTLRHAASLRDWGYELERTFSLSPLTTDATASGGEGALLEVHTRLSNTGRAAFRSPFYSHNFYNVDGVGSGPPWAMHLGMAAPQHRIDAAWGAPLADGFRLQDDGSFVATAPLDEGTKMKASFLRGEGNLNSSRDGSFLLRYGDVRVASSLGAPSVLGTSGASYHQSGSMSGPAEEEAPPLYGYSLYVERDTLSPEPVRMVALQPGQSAMWSQRVAFSRDSSRHFAHYEAFGGDGFVEAVSSPLLMMLLGGVGVATVAGCLGLQSRHRSMQALDKARSMLAVAPEREADGAYARIGA